MADGHTLGLAGSPRGIGDVGHVVGLDRQRELGVVVGQDPRPIGSRGENGSDRLGRCLAAQYDAWFRVSQRPGPFGASGAGQQRHRNAAGLVHPHVGHEPFERLLLADHDRHPLARSQPAFDEAPGQSVGIAVPPADRELGAVGQVPPCHLVRERAREPGSSSVCSNAIIGDQ